MNEVKELGEYNEYGQISIANFPQKGHTMQKPKRDYEMYPEVLNEK
jgi:hypothetical protein